MKTEAKPVIYYLPTKSQHGRLQEVSAKERHTRKRPFSGSYARPHAPKFPRSGRPRW